MEKRQVSTHIPLEEIPSVMRAIGFYPSEEEVGQLFSLLFLKEERARLTAPPKCSKGQILTIAVLDGSRMYLLAFSVFYLICINIVVVRIWQKIPQNFPC